MEIVQLIRRMYEEEKTSVQIFLFIIFSLLLVIIFQQSLSTYHSINHLPFHILLEFINIAIVFSIAIFAWIIFPERLSSYRLYMGMLFFVVGSIELMHMLTYEGMPFFIQEISVARSTWFLLIARTIEALFFYLIVRQHEKELHHVNRPLMLFFSLIAVVAIWLVVDTQINRFPQLVDPGGAILKKLFHSSVIMFHFLIISFVIKEYKRTQNSACIYVVLGSLSIILSEILFTVFTNGKESIQLISPILKIIGHYYYLKSLYIFALVTPNHKRVIEEKTLRKRLKQMEQLIQSFPDAVVVHNNNEVLYCNEKFCELIQRRNGRHMVGLPLEQFIHRDYIDEARNQNETILEKDIILPPSYRKFVLPNEEIADVEVTAVPTFYNNRRCILSVIREVTEQKKLQWELERTKQLYQSLFDYNPEASFMLDKNGKIINVNKSTVSLLGYTKDELLHSSFVPFVHKPNVKEIMKNFDRVLKGEPLTYETKAVRKTGEIIDVSINNVPVIVEGKIIGIIGVARNITEQLKARKRLQASEERYKSLVQLSLQGIFVHDKDYILFCNEETCKLLGVENSEDIIGKPYISFLHPSYRKEIDYLIRRVIDRNEQLPTKHEVKLLRSDGNEIEVELRARVITYDDQQAILCVMNDVTEQKRNEEKLKRANEILAHASRLDGLTNLPNRRYYDEVLEKEWKRVIRSDGCVSLLMIDIDQFKKYNDTYGHLEGDKCLQKVARCLETSVERSTDFVARYGGEEFSVILPETNETGALKVAERIRKKVELLQIENKNSLVKNILTVSVGVATMYPTKDDHWKELIRKADKALYKAKSSGRNCVCFYENKM